MQASRGKGRSSKRGKYQPENSQGSVATSAATTTENAHSNTTELRTAVTTSSKSAPKKSTVRKRGTNAAKNTKDASLSDGGDPDHAFRSKQPPHPLYGHGIQYNPTDVNSKKPVTKLYVTKLQPSMTSRSLLLLFETYGHVTEAKILDTKFSSYGFVTFEHHVDALKALGAVIQYGSHKLAVKEAFQKYQPVPIHIDKLFAITAPDQCYVEKLNDDCLRHIFSYFNFFERTKFEIVCKRWHRISRAMWLVVRELDFESDPLNNLSLAQYDKVFKGLVRYTGKNLVSLVVTRFADASTLKDLGECKNLDRLTLSNFFLTDVKPLKAPVKFLKHFGLKTCQVSERLLCKLLEPMQHLESIFIAHHPGNVAFVEYLAKMKSVDIEHSEIPCHEFEQLLKKSSTTLKELRLVCCLLETQLQDTLVDLVAQFVPELEILKLDRFPLDNPVTVDNVHKLTHLKSLSLNKNASVTSEALLKIARHCKKLESLELSGCARALRTETLVALAKLLPKLSSLSLNACFNSRNPSLQDAALIQFVNALPAPSHFKHLYCSESDLTDEAFFAVLTICTNLETLVVSFCTKITEATVMTAEEMVKTRNNNVVLTLNIYGSGSEEFQVAVQNEQDKYHKNLKIVRKLDRSFLSLEIFDSDSEADMDLDMMDDEDEFSDDGDANLVDMFGLADEDDYNLHFIGHLDGLQDIPFPGLYMLANIYDHDEDDDPGDMNDFLF